MRFTFYDANGDVADIIECHGCYGYWAKFCRRMFARYPEYSRLDIGARVWLTR